MPSGLPNLASLDRDVSAFNERWFLLIREVARHDKVLASAKFGLSALFVDRISRASVDDIRALADSPCLLMVPRSSIALETMLTSISDSGITQSQVEDIRFVSILSEDKEHVA